MASTLVQFRVDDKEKMQAVQRRKPGNTRHETCQSNC